jgi:Cytochrome c7 and related cytochrome c
MQIFPRSLNYLPLIAALAVISGGAGVTFAIWYYGSPWNTQVGYAPVQPVPYSHKLHAGELGIDCRYCHSNIERSGEAMIPPTQTCMGCHAVIKSDSYKLEPVRQSWETNKPVEWVRIHKLPEHAYFDHSAHLAVGVGCTSCHGRVDQMEVVRQDQPLSMGWCLECHRDPGQHLRPKDQITNMAWTPSTDAAELAARAEQVNPPQHCSGCHR